jgi:hypothetical protein
MKTHPGVGVIMAAAVAGVTAACAGLLYSKIVILVFLVRSISRIAGLL